MIDQQSSEALARLLAAAETRSSGASIKTLTLAPHIVHKKPTFAVTCETLKHLALLKQVVAATGLLEQHPQQLTPAVAYVLAYELLFGEGLRRRGPAEVAVVKQQQELRAALAQLLQEAGVQDAAGWLQAQQPSPLGQQQAPVPHPRYARVNTLKASVAEVLAQLQAGSAATTAHDQQQQRHEGPDDAAGGSRKRQKLDGGERSGGSSSGVFSSVRVDELLPDVLVFPPGTDLHDHPLVEQGVLVLQSKASCMPAHALQPMAGWQVVDCCAAPGNKTTHAAALLHAANAAAAAAAPGGGKQGRKRKQQQQLQQRAAAAAASDPAAGTAPAVFAFDKDPKRLRRLVANVARVGARGLVAAQAADFLSIDPRDPRFAQVRGVILDPSCSGSGTAVSRLDHLLPTSSSGGAGADGAGADGRVSAQEQQRLEQLAKFQEAALRHALQFPALQRLVYSTCSIHQRENEDVVASVLPAAQAAGFHLVDPFPAWTRRGLPGSVPGWQLLVRTDAQQDGTDGFFVAVFAREPCDAAAAAAAADPGQEQQGQPATPGQGAAVGAQQPEADTQSPLHPQPQQPQQHVVKKMKNKHKR